MSCTRPILTRRASEGIGCASRAGLGQRPSLARRVSIIRHRGLLVRNSRVNRSKGRHFVVLRQVQESIVAALQLNRGAEEGPRTRHRDHQPPRPHPGESHRRGLSGSKCPRRLWSSRIKNSADRTASAGADEPFDHFVRDCAGSATLPASSSACSFPSAPTGSSGGGPVTPDQ